MIWVRKRKSHDDRSVRHCCKDQIRILVVDVVVDEDKRLGIVLDVVVVPENKVDKRLDDCCILVVGLEEVDLVERRKRLERVDGMGNKNHCCCTE